MDVTSLSALARLVDKQYSRNKSSRTKEEIADAGADDASANYADQSKDASQAKDNTARFKEIDQCLFIDVCARDTQMLEQMSANGYFSRLALTLDDLGPISSASRFEVIKGDLFSDGYDKLEALLASHPDIKPFVYCRPPANNAMTKFNGAVDGLRNHFQDNFYYGDLDIEDILTERAAEPEWYYIFFIMCFVAAYDAQAVIQVNSRLLSLARAEKCRKALVQSGLFNKVIVLPASLSTNREDALLVLSKSGETLRLIDLSQEEITKPDEVLVAFKAAKKKALKVDWPFEGKVAWNLLPSFLRMQPSAPVRKISLGEMVEVLRGASKKTLEALPEGEATEIKLISEKVVETGEILSCEEIGKRGCTTLYTGLDPRADFSGGIIGPTVLLGRVGSPSFTVSLVMPFFDRAEIIKMATGYKPATALSGERSSEELHEWLDSLSEEERAEIDKAAMEAAPKWTPWTTMYCVADNMFSIQAHNFEDAVYLYVFFFSAYGQKLLSKAAHGNTLVQLSARDLRKIPIPYPSAEVRQKIVNSFFEREAQYQLAKQQLEELDATRKAVFTDCLGEQAATDGLGEQATAGGGD